MLKEGNCRLSRGTWLALVIDITFLLLLKAGFAPLPDLRVVFPEAMKFGKRLFRPTGSTSLGDHGAVASKKHS
jgi:hypothetical protein